jgi:hypothetical protein
MALPDKDKIESPLTDLLKILDLLNTNAKDRIECYRELVDWEYIPEEIFKRMVENERLGLISEIDNILNYYRGIN